MNRKGLSFSLTLVIVGVVLLMTALSVITLSGSSLTKWFNTVSGERDATVEEGKIRQACSNLAQQINAQYCQKYVSVDYEGETGSCQDATGETDYLCTNPGSSYETGDYAPEKWGGSFNCGDYTSRSTPKTQRTANESKKAYPATATDAGCTWTGRDIDALSGFNNAPTVTIETSDGGTKKFNCLEEGFIRSKTCPAQ